MTLCPDRDMASDMNKSNDVMNPLQRLEKSKTTLERLMHERMYSRTQSASSGFGIQKDVRGMQGGTKVYTVHPSDQRLCPRDDDVTEQFPQRRAYLDKTTRYESIYPVSYFSSHDDTTSTPLLLFFLALILLTRHCG